MSDESAAPGGRLVPIWNPNAAANWSLIFTPAFGAYIQMLNWQRLGQEPRLSGTNRSCRWQSRFRKRGVLQRRLDNQGRDIGGRYRRSDGDQPDTGGGRDCRRREFNGRRPPGVDGRGHGGGRQDDSAGRIDSHDYRHDVIHRTRSEPDAGKCRADIDRATPEHPAVE